MKLGIIFYLSIFTILHLTGSTAAYFNDRAEVTGIIEVGTWEDIIPWDNSSLEFPNKNAKTSSVTQCTPVEVVIKNGGDKDMKGPVDYEVWWAEEDKNPKDGLKLATGQVNALKSGETQKLSYTPNKNGNYKFKAMQRPGHPGLGELWSESIAVSNCGDTSDGQNEGNQEPPPTEEPKKKDKPTNPPVKTEEPVEPPPSEEAGVTEPPALPKENETTNTDDQQIQETPTEEPKNQNEK